MQVMRISDEDEAAAVALLRRHSDTDFSLTDATSFVAMGRLGIRHAFAFDEDFVRYGFSLLT